MKLQNRSDWSAIALLRRFKLRDTKHIFFTDKKLLSQPTSYFTKQPNLGEWEESQRQAISSVIQRAKFAQHVMVSAGVCFGGKGRLHFVDEKAKVDAAHYVGHLLPKLVENCNQLLPTGFTFQQDGAPAHTARTAQDWLQANCLDFIAKDQWPPNLPNLNPLDYHVCGTMLEAYHKLHPKPKSITGLKL